MYVAFRLLEDDFFPAGLADAHISGDRRSWMANSLGMATQLAQNALRFGWYYGVNWLADAQAGRLGGRLPYSPTRPVPTREAMLADLGRLLLADAEGVRDGLYPPISDEGLALGDHLDRLWQMFDDFPATLGRRKARDASTVREVADAGGMPDYFTQDFHFQTGGYLSENSARLYDVQVETLFYGSANVMRRVALRPIAEAIRGRDQRQLALADVACGTGRFLRQVRLAFPALRLTGIDLSRAYIEEAACHMGGLRPADLIVANVEAMPLGDGSQDFVTAIFLYHELPGEVRRRVTAEIARVLRPGGLFVFIDSLQMGDRPDWDGLLEAFPVRFHEPYFRHYTVDDLDQMLSAAGLAPVTTDLAFLSKVMVRRREPS
jgi:ubiquinone/menaquinone biosynthesis C-methylase UbiE